MQQLSYVVNIWCDVTAAVSIGMFGIFGCNFFLLSANFGTLDKIVDDGKGSGKARAISVIAPIIMAVLGIAAFLSWKDKEKGSIENINGMLRRFFPKGTNFQNVSDEQLKQAENWINHYQRKILGFKTADEVYEAA